MKIACVDMYAQDRLSLQKKVQHAFAECRRTIGHLATVHITPYSLEEAILNRSAEIIVVGSSMPIEDAFHTCKQLFETLPQIPIVLFVKQENFSLRTLARFSKHTAEIFPEEETSVRIVHKITHLAETSKTLKSGKLIVVQGVKGGVGASSIVSGLAHAASAIGRSAIAIDLSQNSSLLHYASVAKTQSPEYASLLSERRYPDQKIVEHCVVEAPNGLHLLIPPSGGSEMREMWLRDPERFEITLSTIDILRELYDIVLVDTAHAEGVLLYALLSHAYARILVTSNDAASVHLLNSTLSELVQIPGDGSIHILPNMIHDRALQKDDILDFLLLNEYFEDAMAALESIPRDNRGAAWIGTGNSFYTESIPTTQRILERTIRILLLAPEEISARQNLTQGFFGSIRQIVSRAVPQHTRPLVGLPFFKKVQNNREILRPPPHGLQSQNDLNSTAAHSATANSVMYSLDKLVSSAKPILPTEGGSWDN